MGLEIGVLFAFAALLFWGFGDFLIQRSTRKFGDWETLFVISAFGAVITTPFVYGDIGPLLSLQDSTFIMLVAVSSIILIAALLDFEALKKGKIAIVEPVYALEVPVSVILGFAVINEGLGMTELALISALVIGLVMVSIKSHHFKRKKWIEKGVLLAVIASLFMGSVNFLVGFASRVSNPLLTNWFIDVFLALICFFYIVHNRRLGKLEHDFVHDRNLIIAVSAFDNLAWIAFAFATIFIPIAIAVAISESYIALAVLFGLVINKELIMKHQKIGLIVALGSAVALSFITI